jgi:hypothetical protein
MSDHKIKDWVGYEREVYRDVFCAALTGICANPHFFGPIMQQSPEAAVEFANSVALDFFKQANARR